MWTHTGQVAIGGPFVLLHHYSSDIFSHFFNNPHWLSLQFLRKKMSTLKNCSAFFPAIFSPYPRFINVYHLSWPSFLASLAAVRSLESPYIFTISASVFVSLALFLSVSLSLCICLSSSHSQNFFRMFRSCVAAPKLVFLADKIPLFAPLGSLSCYVRFTVSPIRFLASSPHSCLAAKNVEFDVWNEFFHLVFFYQLPLSLPLCPSCVLSRVPRPFYNLIWWDRQVTRFINELYPCSLCFLWNSTPVLLSLFLQETVTI